MVAFSKIKRVLQIGTPVSIVVLFLFFLKELRNRKKESRIKFKAGQTSKMKKVHVDKKFLKKLWKLMKMTLFDNSIPKYFICFNFLLVFRTLLTIYLSVVKGKIVKSIISSNKRSFFKQMGNLALAAIPGSICNSGLTYIQNLISLNIRKGLVNKFNASYLKDKVFYQLSNVDSRIESPDQIFTEDIRKFSDELA